jgi:AhpD family alkylhydroperoxidase
MGLMSTPIEYWKLSPDGVKALAVVSSYVSTSGLDHKLINLVYLRASQINGCAFCVDMHVHDALSAGETEQRLHVVGAWRHASHLFTKAEQAALAWTELMTDCANASAADFAQRDAAMETLRQNFTEKQAADLTIAIASINAWNRVAVGMGREPAQRVG